MGPARWRLARTASFVVNEDASSWAPHAGGWHELPDPFLTRTLPSWAPHAGGWHKLPISLLRSGVRENIWTWFPRIDCPDPMAVGGTIFWSDSRKICQLRLHGFGGDDAASSPTRPPGYPVSGSKIFGSGWNLDPQKWSPPQRLGRSPQMVPAEAAGAILRNGPRRSGWVDLQKWSPQKRLGRSAEMVPAVAAGSIPEMVPAAAAGSIPRNCSRRSGLVDPQK